MNKRDFAMGFVAGILVFWAFAAINQSVTSNKAPSTVALSTPSAQTCKYPKFEEDSILIQVNEYRLSKGLEQLQRDVNLLEFARFRANEIETTGNYNHQGQYDGFFKWGTKAKGKDFTVYLSSVGELLMKGASDACATVQAWKESPTHDAGLLSKEADYIGIGVSGNTVVVSIGTAR